MTDQLAKKIGELDQKISEVEATDGALKIVQIPQRQRSCPCEGRVPSECVT